jgi:hypothetical protein
MIVEDRGHIAPREGRTAGRPGSVRISVDSLSDPQRGVRRRGERRLEEAAGTRSHGMTKYLISFDDGAMTFPEEELPDVADAARAVRVEAKDAGVWVFSAGLEHQVPSVVATDGTVTDGTVTDGPYPETKEHLGGFAVVDVPSREEALEWAAKIAAACRCAQEVFELLPDPTG